MSEFWTLLLVVFVLCSYFQWKRALRSARWINAGPLAERERALPLVWGLARLTSTRLSIQLKWTNHIDCLWARLRILIWLGGLPSAQAPHTHCGDWLDFKPAQDAGKFVGCRVRGPFDPHVLLREVQRGEIRKPQLLRQRNSTDMTRRCKHTDMLSLCHTTLKEGNAQNEVFFSQQQLSITCSHT